MVPLDSRVSWGVPRFQTRNPGTFRNKPKDLNGCVSEECEYEGGPVMKLNSENRLSTGDVFYLL